MERLTVSLVFKQLPLSLKYFFLGIAFGSALSFFLYIFSKKVLKIILNLWIERILFGVRLLGERYLTLWFILNNLIALLLVVLACILIVIHVSKTPEYVITGRFKSLERKRPKIILFGLYMIPLGALVMNGFFVSLFVTYILLSFGVEKFILTLALLFPHGINEMLALLFASSLALAYLQILRPIILKGKWKLAMIKGKKLLASKVTIFFIILILLLTVFSGFIEGLLVLVLR